MALVKKDYRGLNCPLPTLNLIPVLQKEVHPGDILEVMADCPTFEVDMKKFCQTWKKPIIKMTVVDGIKTVTIKI